MLKNNLQKNLKSPSLSEILHILSTEYGEDLSHLINDPHHWVIVKDKNTGLIGGICLTPSTITTLPNHLLLAKACQRLQAVNVWVGSHFFCWIPQEYDDNETQDLKQYVAFLYLLLYEKFVEICATHNISHAWLLLTAEQFSSLAESACLPFEAEMAYTYQGEEYITALLPALSKDELVLRYVAASNNVNQYKIN